MDIQNTDAGRLQTLMFQFLDRGMPKPQAWAKACWIEASRAYSIADEAEHSKVIVPDDPWFNIPIFLRGVPNIAIDPHASLRTRWREWDHRAGKVSQVIPGKTIYVVLGWAEQTTEESDLRIYGQRTVEHTRITMQQQQRKALYIDRFIMMCMYEEINSLFQLIRSIRA